MTHGILTEHSLNDSRLPHDRKGREGKGRGREEEGKHPHSPSIHSVQERNADHATPWMAASR